MSQTEKYLCLLMLILSFIILLIVFIDFIINKHRQKKEKNELKINSQSNVKYYVRKIRKKVKCMTVVTTFGTYENVGEVRYIAPYKTFEIWDEFGEYMIAQIPVSQFLRAYQSL